MTSPQESRSILVDPATLPYRLFLCNEDRESLAGTAALDYIRHGEAQGFHKRSSVRSRRLWYGLGEWNETGVGINYQINTTARAYLAKARLHYSDNFQQVHTESGSSVQLAASLNATLTQLMLNTIGRANFGGGLMKIQTYEMESVLMIDANLLPSIDEGIFRSAQWDVMDPSAERREIDGVVFDALGLTEGERAGVYEAVSDLVGKRLAKAKSLRK